MQDKSCMLDTQPKDIMHTAVISRTQKIRIYCNIYSYKNWKLFGLETYQIFTTVHYFNVYIGQNIDFSAINYCSIQLWDTLYSQKCSVNKVLSIVCFQQLS